MTESYWTEILVCEQLKLALWTTSRKL